MIRTQEAKPLPLSLSLPAGQCGRAKLLPVENMRSNKIQKKRKHACALSTHSALRTLYTQRSNDPIQVVPWEAICSYQFAAVSQTFLETPLESSQNWWHLL